MLKLNKESEERQTWWYQLLCWARLWPVFPAVTRKPCPLCWWLLVCLYRGGTVDYPLRNSHVKRLSMLIGKFKLHLKRRPIWAWHELYLTPFCWQRFFLIFSSSFLFLFSLRATLTRQQIVAFCLRSHLLGSPLEGGLIHDCIMTEKNRPGSSELWTPQSCWNSKYSEIPPERKVRLFRLTFRLIRLFRFYRVSFLRSS